MYEQPVFAELLLAWLLGLLFTWVVIEPSEVLALVLLPALTQGERVMYCREKCKELGIYG